MKPHLYFKNPQKVWLNLNKGQVEENIQLKLSPQPPILLFL